MNEQLPIKLQTFCSHSLRADHFSVSPSILPSALHRVGAQKMVAKRTKDIPMLLVLYIYIGTMVKFVSMPVCMD